MVVADLDAEVAIRTLLLDRQPALGIRLDFDPGGRPLGDLLRYSGRDCGCRKDAVELLREPQRTHEHAVLLFDQHGSGAEEQDRTQVEADIEEKLYASGWPEGSVAAIVIQPELEAWVWSDSPHVARSMGWESDIKALRKHLEACGFWPRGSAKPHDPKAAMEIALRQRKKAFNATIFSQLAGQVGLGRCRDASFAKFRKTLQQWFPRVNLL